MIPDDAELWQRIKEIAADALEREPSGRRAFVEQACAGNEQLQVQVGALLADELGTHTENNFPLFNPSDFLGQEFGPYRIERRIGRGGLGEVYAAVRTDKLNMRVAIKIPLPEFSADQEFCRRFQSEAQVLALLSHPHIVTLHDNGATPEGRPYFVMEYIEGMPIDSFCASRRLSVRQRLSLFLDICDAVQYAHTRLIIHRDLKPANVLVTAEGQVKLLDFGIAKLLIPQLGGDAQVFTRPGYQPLTYEYASPEQLDGGLITTASDIYSLGVLLYRLLTSQLPFQTKGLTAAEYRQMVCTQEPPLPSEALRNQDVAEFRNTRWESLSRLLRGELDNIVLMALRKEPDRRYATAAQFAEDVRRYLDGRPVIAQPDSAGYRVRKFTRRHRMSVAAAVVVLLSLTVGLAAVSWQAQRAEAQRRRAEQNLQTTLASVRTLGLMQQMCLLEAAVKQADKQLSTRLADKQLWQDLARFYEQAAELLAANGKMAEANDVAQKAVDLRKEIAREQPDDPNARQLLAEAQAKQAALPSTRQMGTRFSTALATTTYDQLGDLLRLAGDSASAEKAHQTGKLLSELDKRAAAAHQNQTNGRQGAWLDAPSGAGHSGSEPKNRFRPK